MLRSIKLGEILNLILFRGSWFVFRGSWFVVWGETMRLIIIACAFLLSGCVTRGDTRLDDVSVVRAPAYSANRVLFAKSSPDNRYADLKEGYEIAADAARPGSRRSVRNRDPLSIVISRAYVPADIATCNARSSDFLLGKDRDIAVLLDVSSATDRQEFIAVWYETNVPAGQVLTFQDLLVYSSDSWDAKYPPYFRLRLVDVSAERNTATGELLKQVRSSSSTIAGLVGVPEAGPILGIAALAANQVLGHEKNRALVDFTFQLYDEGLLGQSGGVPLGILQTGGMVVTAPPCGSANDFWTSSFKFDHRLQRIAGEQGPMQGMPYVFATILTADLSVPQIVRTRSAAIMKRLTDPQVAQADLAAAQADAGKLTAALNALNVRETFRRRPSKESFATMVSDVSSSWGSLDAAEQGFFKDAFYQITGAALPDAAAYKAWTANCSVAAPFNAQTGRFEPDTTINGKDTKPCWPV